MEISKDVLFLRKLRVEVKHMEVIERHTMAISTKDEETISENKTGVTISGLRSFAR